MPSPNAKKRDGFWERITRGQMDTDRVAWVDAAGRPQAADNLSDPLPGLFFRNSLNASSMLVVGTLGTPIDFSCTPPAGEIYVIHRVALVMSDTSVGALDFGGIAGGLTNGIQLYVDETIAGAPVATPVFDETIKSNVNMICKSGTFHSITYGTTSVLKLDVPFAELTNSGIYLDGSFAMSLRFSIQDDMTSLTSMRAVYWGRKYFPGAVT